MLIKINGHQINLQDEGEPHKPAVVLLHHGLGSVWAWRGQIPAYVQAGFKVIAYDRWGYGESDSRPALDLPTFGTDLDDLEVLLEKLQIQQAALVGHSDGGTIALYFAAHHPQQVSCLVTVAAHIYVEPKMEPELLNLRTAFESDERFRNGMKLSHADKFESVFYNWFNGWHSLESLSWDMRPILRQVTCPVLAVQGEEDEHATQQHAMDIANSIPAGQVWIVPGAKHMLPQENIAEFNDKTLRFLEDHASSYPSRDFV